MSFPKNLSARIRAMREKRRASSDAMLAILHLLGTSVMAFSSRGALKSNLFLRHQLNVALRRVPRHLRLRGKDRALLVWMTWLWRRLLGLLRVVQAEVDAAEAQRGNEQTVSYSSSTFVTMRMM